MAEPTESVSVRLPSTYVQLIKRSADNAKTSISDFLRPIILKGLDDDLAQELAQLRQEVGSSREAVQNLREDVATALAAFLAYLSPILPETYRKTPQELQQWVAEHFEE